MRWVYLAKFLRSRSRNIGVSDRTNLRLTSQSIQMAIVFYQRKNADTEGVESKIGLTH
ncbi:hypothetical protein [Spirulina sp. 06S082]|uniref:hypothetical protein n=1 Tax=Spirulina sp. 06S082 TaxID=3110248 RepID=UPI002B1FB990|nr:hypothetical protein [Spirulina sp. 06S082]MEA5470073.1 hypothetical protein [Spirulina sp. 06S082]